MIVKKLYDEYDLNLERLLLNEYARLNLTYEEASILSLMFSLYKKKDSKLSSVIKKTERNKEEVEKILNTLDDKAFISLHTEHNDKGKQVEIFVLDNCFSIIENFLETEEKKEKKEDSEVSKIVLLLEKKMNKTLSVNELLEVKKWFVEKIPTSEIISAIDKFNSKSSLYKISSFLLEEYIEKEEVDEKTKNLLDKLYDKL
ncbi:MAG: hypothetical protein LBV58_02850 [Acholeplasmatales bacterium]|jgi:hypothetical protein|nr:hypothetical protein [Acholeplasmatales bacterium]